MVCTLKSKFSPLVRVLHKVNIKIGANVTGYQQRQVTNVKLYIFWRSQSLQNLIHLRIHLGASQFFQNFARILIFHPATVLLHSSTIRWQRKKKITIPRYPRKVKEHQLEITFWFTRKIRKSHPHLVINPCPFTSSQCTEFSTPSPKFREQPQTLRFAKHPSLLMFNSQAIFFRIRY